MKMVFCNVLFIGNDGFDYLSSQLIEGLHLLSNIGDINFKCTHANTHHGARVKDLQTITTEEALDNISWADFILFSSGGDMGCFKGGVAEALKAEALSNKRVFIDGHDSDAFLIDPHRQLVYFKREMRYPSCNRFFHNNIRSITFGVYEYLFEKIYVGECNGWDDRDIDICFMAFGGSNKAREECSDVLWQTDYRTEVHVSQDSQPIDQEKYHDILYRSKVGISLIGAGLDTLRFWETPAHGAVLCSMDISTMLFMRNAFEGNRHCLYFSSWQMMLELIRLVVLDKCRWTRMRQAMDLCLPKHSTTHRAQEVIEICQEMV